MLMRWQQNRGLLLWKMLLPILLRLRLLLLQS